MKKTLEKIKSSKIFLLLKNCFLFLIRIYFKFNILLLHLFSENHFLYLVYMFLVVYGLYDCKSHDVECTLSHDIAFIIVLYFLAASAWIYMICNIPLTRKYLDNLVGKDYVIKYLGK